MSFNIIVAVDEKNGIGKENTIPWKCKSDMKYFRETTLKTKKEGLKNIIVMGRKTYKSLPIKPLPNRINIILSSTTKQEDYPEDVILMSKLDDVLKYYNIHKKVLDKIWIIGGSKLYEDAYNHSVCRDIHITKIEGDYECDVRFPEINYNNFQLIETEFLKDFVKVDIYRKRNKQEDQYLNLLSKTLYNGIEKQDRTGTGTLSIFGGYLRFDISKRFPLLTTKRMYIKGIFEELMWILRGETDSKILAKKGVHIWDGNSTRDFLDKRGLTHYETGDIGPTYGFAVRNYGDTYNGCNKKYDGFDQLEYAVDLLKNNPSSRRILINLWDPTTINRVALTPCMMTYNFHVDIKNKKLNLQMYIRSSDILLGLPWNIAYAGLFVYLMCNVKGIDLTPGELIICTCDQHLYKNHLEQAKKNLLRYPYEFPKLTVKKEVNDITDFEYDDILLEEYNSYQGIKAQMAV